MFNYFLSVLFGMMGRVPLSSVKNHNNTKYVAKNKAPLHVLFLHLSIFSAITCRLTKPRNKHTMFSTSALSTAEGSIRNSEKHGVEAMQSQHSANAG